MRRRDFLTGLAAMPVLAGAARGQTAYPTRPARILVGTAAGGPNDFAARATAQLLTDAFGESVVVENRTGAGGTIAADSVARASPDGYTMFMASAANMCIAPHLYPKLPYDPVKDFAPISTIGRISFVAVVNPAVPAKSITELIALAKAKPGAIRFGSAGTGTATHLSAELFKSMAGVNMIHVPYKGGAPAMVDLIAGNIELMFDSVITSVPQVKAGKVRALAQTGSRRSDLLADLPTIAEAGVPGYESTSWFGLVAPAGTPADVIGKLNGALVKSLGDPQIRDRLVKGGLDPETSTPEALAALIRTEIGKWGAVVKSAGVAPG